MISDQPGKTHLVSHQINLKPGTMPCRSTPYRLSPDKMDFVQTEIATLKNKVLSKTRLVIVPRRHQLLL